MTYDEWVQTYRPVLNTFDANASYDGRMYETFGNELAQVMLIYANEPNRVWTLCDEDGQTFIASGYHYVNRLGYFVTEVPLVEDCYLEINLDD